VSVASTSAVQQGFNNFFKKKRAAPTPMGTRAPVRGACVSAMAIIGARGAEGTRKKLRADALAFPTAAAPPISPRLCGPPTGLTNAWSGPGPRPTVRCLVSSLKGPKKKGSMVNRNSPDKQIPGRKNKQFWGDRKSRVPTFSKRRI
jgi:hypothetical protein